MSIAVKIVVTVVGSITCLFLVLIRKKAWPDNMWSLGRRDPFRFLLCRRDSHPRKFTIPIIILWIAASVIVMWFTE